MKTMKKFAGIALAGAIGLCGLDLMGTNQVSAAEPVTNVKTLNTESKQTKLLQREIFDDYFYLSGTSNWQNSFWIDSDDGRYLNVWMNTYGNQNLGFRVIAPNGRVFESYSQGSNQQFQQINIWENGDGYYQFTALSNNNSSGNVQFRARAF